MNAIRTNTLGQPIGFEVSGWRAPVWPARSVIEGRHCNLEPLEERHAPDLHAANTRDVEGRNWTYLAYGPFGSVDEYRRWLSATCLGKDPMFFAVIDRALGKATGVASYLRIQPENGSIEVGHINFSPLLQRNRAATEAMYLMMNHAFDLGYRRYEWKCDALNAPSRAAAQRLGLSYRGHLPSGNGLQEPEPRYGVVRHHRFGLARAARRLRPVAGRSEFR